MGSLGVSVCFIVMLVQFNFIITKPLFFDLLCDLFCDDDDVTSTSTTTSASNEDDYYDDMCSCTPATRRPPRPTGGPGNMPSAINMILPPSNGMNLSMFNNNGLWTFGMNALPNALGAPVGATSTTGAPTTGAPTTAAPTTAAPTTAAAK